MTIWLGIFYGVLQGLTEFLPVSSSGHLVLVNQLFGVSDCNFVFFSVLLHLATLFAVMLVLRKEIKFLFFHPFSKEAKMLYLATLPTVVIVLCFKGFFEDAFSGKWLPLCFCVTAVLLVITEVLGNKLSGKKMDNKSSFLVGLMQGIAVLPGISRSGATICTAVLCGVSRESATKFSFILSIPIILASICFEVFEAVVDNQPIFDTPLLPTVLAFVVAFVVGVLCVKFMLKTFQKIKLWWFSLYLFALSGISFVML